MVAPTEIQNRCGTIRNSWTAEERDRRAYTARMVQWLLVGPPVGFHLVSD